MANASAPLCSFYVGAFQDEAFQVEAFDVTPVDISLSVQGGTLSPSVVLPTELIGRQATTQQGALVPVVDISVVLTEQQVTTQQGTLSATATVVLTGQQATTQQGTLSATVTVVVTVALAGQQLVVEKGEFVTWISCLLDGHSGITVLTDKLIPGIECGLRASGLLVSTSELLVTVDANIVLAGQVAVVTNGILIPIVSPVLASQELQVFGGAFVSGTVAGAVLNGQELTTLSGSVLIRDKSVFLVGLQLVIFRGAFSSARLASEYDLWAWSKIEELFVSLAEEEPLFVVTPLKELSKSEELFAAFVVTPLEELSIQIGRDLVNAKLETKESSVHRDDDSLVVVADEEDLYA